MEQLFKELTFSNGVKAKNKFLLAPLTNMQSPDQGRISDDEFIWLTKRAEGGFGIIMTCAMPVLKSGIGWKGQLGIYDPKHEDGHYRLNERLHNLEALSIAQIFHAGIRADINYSGDKIGPSMNSEKSAREMSIAEIEEMKVAFVECAIRAHQCNYDGIELHAAHGYLIGQFLSKKFNKREDDYGGSFKNRAKFLIDIIEEIKEKTSSNFLIGVRISPERFGLDTNEMITLYKTLCENNNIHFIDISLWDSFKLVDDGPFTGESLLKLFTTIDRGSKLLTVAGKIFSYEDIEILQNNNVDFFCLGRAAILDHQFPKRLKAEGSNFQPYSAPVTRDHLLKEGLSETFVNYMATWKNFVSESA